MRGSEAILSTLSKQGGKLLAGPFFSQTLSPRHSISLSSHRDAQSLQQVTDDVGGIFDGQLARRTVRVGASADQ